jgi:hypothetical protein
MSIRSRYCARIARESTTPVSWSIRSASVDLPWSMCAMMQKWTWVPFEEDHSRGKDRPVLLVGSHGRYLLGLMLTSKDHDGHARARLDYVDIGTGPWDRQGRPSEAKLARVLQIHPADIRREGSVLDRKKFRLVADELRRLHGWT